LAISLTLGSSSFAQGTSDPDSDIAGFDNYITEDGIEAIVSYMQRLPADRARRLIH